MTLTGLLFVAGFFGGLSLALIRSPMFGLLTYVAVFYLDPPSRWWGHSLPDLRWSMVAAAVTLIGALRYKSDVNRAPWLSTTPAKLLIAYTAWLWIQNLWALDPVKHLACCILFTKFILVYFMVYRLLDTPEKMRWFYLVHIGGCLYLGLIALSSFHGGRLDGVGGPGIDDSNTLGMHISTGALAAGTLLLVEKKGWWLFCAAGAALALNTMVMAGSRGAFLALVAGGLVLALLRPRAHAKKFLIYASLGVLAFGYVASEQFWERMNTLEATVETDQQLDNSAESRIQMAKAQLEMAKRYPFGNGHRGSEVLSAQYLDAKYLTSTGGRSSHNTFLTTLVEQGIPGALMFFGYIIWGARSYFRLRELNKSQEFQQSVLYASIALSSLVIVFVAGMFADFLKVEIQIWMTAVVAVVLQQQAVPIEAKSRAGTVLRGRPRVAASSTNEA